MLRRLTLLLFTAALTYAADSAKVDIYWNDDNDANLYINGVSVLGEVVNPKPNVLAVYHATAELREGDVVAFSASDTCPPSPHVVAVVLAGDNILFGTAPGAWEGLDGFPDDAWLNGKGQGYPVGRATNPGTP